MIKTERSSFLCIGVCEEYTEHHKAFSDDNGENRPFRILIRCRECGREEFRDMTLSELVDVVLDN